MAIFKGAGVAIATPMKENLEVNYDKLDEMLEEQIAGGTDAIVICGTTGESATMTEEEHAVYKRGRNAKSVSPAKNQSITDYRRATGFEALLGYLYLKKEWKRMLELVKIGLDSIKE